MCLLFPLFPLSHLHFSSHYFRFISIYCVHSLIIDAEAIGTSGNTLSLSLSQAVFSDRLIDYRIAIRISRKRSWHWRFVVEKCQ
jgi:hypothetical protein